MTKDDAHLVSSCSDKFTQVIFKPDFQKLNMKFFEKNVVSLMRKRVLEVANFLGDSVVVEMNGDRIPAMSFTNYVNFYLSSSTKSDPLTRFACSTISITHFYYNYVFWKIILISQFCVVRIAEEFNDDG